MSATRVYMISGSKVVAATWRPTWNTSIRVMAKTRLVPLTRSMKSLASGGMAMRIACGATTLRKVVARDRFRVWAASNWPRGSDRIEARTAPEEGAPEGGRRGATGGGTARGQATEA